jgi:hypothetical protein
MTRSCRRRGKQNYAYGVAEGSMASGTSKKTELKLIGVARASLEELLLDFQDFLRQKGLRLWGKDHAKAKEVRALEKEFLKEGGFTERLYRARSEARGWSRNK